MGKTVKLSLIAFAILCTTLVAGINTAQASLWEDYSADFYTTNTGSVVAQSEFNYDSDIPAVYCTFDVSKFTLDAFDNISIKSSSKWTWTNGSIMKTLYYDEQIGNIDVANGQTTYSYWLDLPYWASAKQVGDWTVEIDFYDGYSTGWDNSVGFATETFKVTMEPPAPEPVSMILMSLGGLGFFVRKKIGL